MKNYYKVYNENGLHFTTEASNDDEFWDHIAKLGIMGSYQHIVRVDRARGFRSGAPYKTIWERESCHLNQENITTHHQTMESTNP